MNVIEFSVSNKNTFRAQQIKILISKYNGIYTRELIGNGSRYSIRFETTKLKDSFNKELDVLLPDSFNY